MATLLTAFEDTRPLLNDNNVGPSVWIDALLLKFVPKAHRELQILLWENGIPVIKEISSALAVAALATVFTTPPTDIIVPISMKERLNGSSEEYVPLEELDFENVSITQSDILRYYCWREEAVRFVGATTARQVMMRYLKGITVPAATNSPIGFIFGEMYLGPRIAALAAGSVGDESSYVKLTDDANKWIDKIVAANVKGGQSLPVQRIPYRRARRSRNSMF